MLHYLDEDTARSLLIDTKQYTEETAPTKLTLSVILENLEACLHGWLGYCPFPSDYTDTLHTNTHGYVILPQYPVISINSVEPLATINSLNDPVLTPLNSNPLMFSYAQGSRWEQNSTIILSEYRGTVRVQYRAGYEPLPSTFKAIMFQVLQKSLNQDIPGDFSFLNNPSRDTQSLSIPAVSKSWRVSQPKIAGETEGDRIFGLLSEYRRHYRF